MPTYIQNAFFIGADTTGAVQIMDVGKDDNGVPIFFKLETQELEFNNRGHLKKIADEISVFSTNGGSSTLSVASDIHDYKPVPIDLSTEVAIGQNINAEGHYFVFKWSGQASTSTPILEGIYLENVTDYGIANP